MRFYDPCFHKPYGFVVLCGYITAWGIKTAVWFMWFNCDAICGIELMQFMQFSFVVPNRIELKCGFRQYMRFMQF